MDMRKYDELEKMLCDELEQIVNKGELTAGGLETVDKLLHSMKCLKKVMESEEGYSGDGDWTARGSYGRGGRYSRDGGMMYTDGSYNGGSYRNQRRDSRGRYSSDGDMDGMIRKLEQIERNANPADRETIRAMIEEMRAM